MRNVCTKTSFQKWCARKSNLVTEGQRGCQWPIPTGAHENKNSQGFLCNMKNLAVLLQIITILSLRISRYCTHTVQAEENTRFWKSFLFIFRVIFKRSINLGGTPLKWNDLFYGVCSSRLSCNQSLSSRGSGTLSDRCCSCCSSCHALNAYKHIRPDDKFATAARPWHINMQIYTTTVRDEAW